jgi:hypothetical protein
LDKPHPIKITRRNFPWSFVNEIFSKEVYKTYVKSFVENEKNKNVYKEREKDE